MWACIEIGAIPLTKKGADKGIDGWLPFADLDETPHRAVVQVKGGKVSVSQIRDFCHVIGREKATLGFFVCNGQVTKPMQAEALGLGMWESANGNCYPRCQILSIEDVLARRAAPRLPMQEKRSILGYKATKATRAKDKNLQLEL